MVDPLVTEECGIDWPDVTERTYNTLRQAALTGLAIIGLNSGAEAVDLANIDVPILTQAGMAVALSAAMGLATLTDNVVRQWLACRRTKAH